LKNSRLIYQKLLDHHLGNYAIANKYIKKIKTIEPILYRFWNAFYLWLGFLTEKNRDQANEIFVD
jgi:hypothetical protein